MDAMDTDLVQSDKKCSTCRVNIVPAHLNYKNCSVCREKNRIKQARRVEKKREQSKYLEASRNMLTESIEMNVDEGEATTAETQPLHKLKGKEKQSAIEQIKASLQKSIRDNGGTTTIVEQMPKNQLPGSATEFQAASLLYEKLRTRVIRSSATGKRLKFHGCHSIIAVPTINHENRVDMVAEDLRKIVHLLFGVCVTFGILSDYSKCSMTYDCGCLSSASGSLIGSSNQAQAVRCFGTVQVTAELDNSHPHGLEGQKISVHIYH